MKFVFSSLLTCCCILAGLVYAGELDEGLQLAKELHEQAVSSQKRVDKAAAQTQAMLEEYQQLMLDTDFHETRRQQLLTTLEQQRKRQQQLQNELAQIQTTEKRLGPLLLGMVQGLERFIVLDLPFHHQQRIDSVLILRERVLDPGLSLADRFQLTMEAFQIELDYGYSLEAYRDEIDWQGEPLSVECLRVGRLALYFVTPNVQQAGVWDRGSKQWQPLPEESVRTLLQGIRVAKGQLAPELLPLPVVAELAP